jgi:uroporphyrin-III C-methyltransferase/precorrin-2 dehydrogenase/sirohydrochlorin ferrochelatase
MRATGLPIIVRLDGREVVLAGTGDAADAKRRLLERAGAIVVGDSASARIAIVAVEDDAAARETATRLKAEGKLVNVVDRPDLCDFTLPAIVDRSPVLVAVATGGASAGLAAALRQRIEAVLPARLGALADALSVARASMRARWPDAGERRRALGKALGPGEALDPLDERAAARVAAWLATDAPRPADRIETILLASDDPDLLTLRDARLLSQADRIVHAPDIPETILSRARADAERMVGDAVPGLPYAGLTVHVVRG